MYCKKCGKKIDDNSKKCDNCQFDFEEEFQNKKELEVVNKSRRVEGLVFCFLFGIIGYFVGLLAFRKNKVEKKTFCDGGVVGLILSFFFTIFFIFY